ncbi:hypothetical protein [Dactylococcopsis salina]|uniref:Uncharacterized protein n=1 Tax=Dactylococcopsis salina (strain PCC 8305) TaxID=13035 RepID=K9YQV4_DACS8|nr:hypothetical protein [Dactylococcopsis salina]AFZ49284.1 hypothetical protein Dacsa_0500 [Dactylococcopsis salina PCC 8305]
MAIFLKFALLPIMVRLFYNGTRHLARAAFSNGENSLNVKNNVAKELITINRQKNLTKSLPISPQVS